MLLRHSPNHGFNRILALGRATCIKEIGHIEGLVVQLGAVAVDVVLNVIVLLSHYTPAAENAAVGLDSNKPSVENVGSALSHCTY